MRTPLLIPGLLLLVVSGCSPQAPANKPTDACALMPKEVAEDVLGVKLTQPNSQSFGENPRQTVISNCQYVSTTSKPVGSLTFTIRIGSVSDSALSPAETLIATMKQEFGQRYDLKKVTGLADGAVWDSSLKQLTVFQGTSTYVWAAPGATSGDLEDKLVTLARKTIARV